MAKKPRRKPSRKRTAPVDPDALERRLQRDLEILREYREASRKYREVSARYAVESPTAIPVVAAPPHSTTARRESPSAQQEVGLIETAEQLLPNEWEGLPVLLRRVVAVRPKTTRAPLRNAVTRLVDQGIAEKKGDKKTGVTYRRKPA